MLPAAVELATAALQQEPELAHARQSMVLMPNSMPNQDSSSMSLPCRRVIAGVVQCKRPHCGDGNQRRNREIGGSAQRREITKPDPMSQPQLEQSRFQQIDVS